jgi:hypothetical protein
MSLTLLDGITIGAFGGASAGLIVWFVQWRKEKLADWLDKRKIYNWLYEDAKKTNKLTVSSAMDVRWMPTESIACFTNLSKERVRYLCSIHKKIVPKLQTDWMGSLANDSWALKESVPNHGNSREIP